MRRTHRLLGTTRSWVNEAGQKQKSRIECGAIFTSDAGRISVRITALPITKEFDGWLSAVPCGENDNPSDE